MSDELVSLLRVLAADPLRLIALTSEQRQEIVATLRAMSGGDRKSAAAAPPEPAWSAGDLLTVEEAAGLLRVSRQWLYRHAKDLPFSRKLSRKVLRFSRAGLDKWVATRRT